MDEIKERILNVLIKKRIPMDANSIYDEINVNLADVCEALIELEQELKVRNTKKGKYMPTDFISGKINIAKNGNGFVKVLGSKDICINRKNLRNAIDGDNVVVQITNDQNEGKILKVLSHANEYEVGQVVIKDHETYVELDAYKKKHILLQVNDSEFPLVEGHKVSVCFGALIRENVYEGFVTGVIGHINDPKIDIICKAVMHEINPKFPDEVIEEAKKTPVKVTKEEMIGRRDLRDSITITIDGDDAKDLDDAISIEKLENGNYLLGVHIADVAYYVPKNSILDQEAYRRATSSYFPGTVIPMLPHELSNGICSLHENVDRLTKTCMMEIDPQGNVVNYEIFNSIINSKKRMTYKKVADILSDTLTDESYMPFIDDIMQMKELSDILNNKRRINGSIDFDNSETKIEVDEFGKAIDIIKEERLESEDIIQEFMIITNVIVATHARFLDLPFPYRVHGKPSSDKLDEFIKFALLMKENIKKMPKQIRSKYIQQLTDSLKKSPNYEIYSYLLLRCMQKAKYDINNIGHFGLGLAEYTHFTAPIRRYPDLMVHRLLDNYNNPEFYQNENNIEALLSYLCEATAHASIKEQKTAECEREVHKMKAAEYMESHIGETFSGKITSVYDYGFYVDFYNGVQGLVKINELNKATFEKEILTITTADNIKYKIGDFVEVVVNNAVKEMGIIDLTIIKKLDHELSLTLK